MIEPNTIGKPLTTTDKSNLLVNGNIGRGRSVSLRLLPATKTIWTISASKDTAANPANKKRKHYGN